MQGYSALLGGIGLVAIVFGLISLLLLILGAPTDLTWIYANFGIGVILLAVWGIDNLATLRERMGSSEARRVGTYGTSAVLSTALTIVILALIGFFGTRYNARFDWSAAGVHSLSDQTHKVLDQLERDVEAVGFYPPIEAQPVRDLLERYEYASDRFGFQIADPTTRPDLVQKYGYERELEDGLVRVAIGEEAVEVTDQVTEEAVTNAIVKLTRTQEKKVYFLTGHNERPVSGEGAAEAEGFQLAARALRNENYLFEELLLEARGGVPEDADVVVVAGATRPLRPAEHEALREYLGRGGALLVMLDPRARTDLYGDLTSWGVELGEDVVVDRAQGLFGRAASPFAGQYGDHPITQDMREAALFHVARSVTANPAAGDGRFTEIVLTGDQSWAEKDLDRFFEEGTAELDDEDLRGPVSVAVAGTAKVEVQRASFESEERAEQAAEEADGDSEVEARLVVFGDSDFASNQLVEAYRNRDLFVNSVNWLIGDVEAISIRPHRPRASRIQLTNEEFSQIRYLSLFVLPETIAVLGVFAWWSRRRAPGR